MSTFVTHEPCPSCGSHNNLARYDDGHAYCFGCQYREGTEKGMGKPSSFEFLAITPKALLQRKLNLDTCTKWGYGVSVYQGKPCQVATYRTEQGTPVVQKLRFADKSFLMLGEKSSKDSIPLYGMNLWSGGKIVVVTEGEIDALTVSQLQGNKWPVVSVPTGASGAFKAIKTHLNWFDGFEKVILMFDQDDAGQQAALRCAELFKPGHAALAKLSMKDPNELLLAGRGDEIIREIFNAKPYRPDGIVEGKDTWEFLLKQSHKKGVSYPFDGLNVKTQGIRRGEVVTVCAGTGIGKSQLCREIALHLITLGEKVGYIALEEGLGKTVASFVGLSLGQPIHASLEPSEEVKKAWEGIAPKLVFYDHFGSLDTDILLNRLRYMAMGLDCTFIVLDHLSIVISGIREGDERRLIDNTMTKLRSLVEEQQIGLILVSHLRRSDGKPHEEGGVTSLSHLRGSGGTAHLSDIVLGLERNQQSDTPHETVVRVLKNRFSGNTGVACTLTYDLTTGRMSEGTETQGFQTQGFQTQEPVAPF